MRQILVFLTLLVCLTMPAQTFHAIIFSDMTESQERSADREAEMKNSRDMVEKLADAIGYTKNIKCHSGSEFTSEQFLKDISSINPGERDIVMMIYNGHGCNWDDDDWPHMAFRDRQYWSTSAYDKMQEKCGNAKLLITIAQCCNMDSEGRKRLASTDYGNLDPRKVMYLLTGFDGKKKILTSSSKRGEYSYSWSSSNGYRPGQRIGSIYGISLREALDEILSSSSEIEPSWENVFKLAKSKTMRYTTSPNHPVQTPQYKIEETSKPLSSSAQKVLNRLKGNTNRGTATAQINSASAQKNVRIGDKLYAVVKVNFSVNNLSEKGGRVIAYLESPKGMGVKDLNGRYKTTDGKVSVGKDFGTRKQSASFPGFELIIPMEELHITNPANPHYFNIAVYDYDTKKFLSTNYYVNL